MKINSILNHKLSNHKTFTQDKNSGLITQNNNKNKYLAIGCAATVLAGVTGVLLYKKHKSQVLDIDFKNKILSALKNDGIDVPAKSLNSIVGPEEFSKLIKKFKPEHYRVGLQTAKSEISTEKFYANAINGDFRVSLHTHSNFSDGKATPEEFLECARQYADKVARLSKKDDLPPFTIALTDHDCIDGTKEIIKIIAKNPEKYKNLKFVAGCEFSVKNGDKHYDVTGLALNPFEESLNKMLQDLKSNRMNTVNEFLKSKNTKISMEDLINCEKQYYISKAKNGKRTLENGSGVVFVRHAVKFFYKLIDKPIDKIEMNKLGTKDILPINQVLETINKNGGVASLTHPLKSFWTYIGDGELLKLKEMGIKGIEVNHQYTPSKIKKLGEKSGYGVDKADNALKELTEKYKDFAEKNDMFLSGGTDSHEKQIFSREPKISQNLLEEKFLK